MPLHTKVKAGHNVKVATGAEKEGKIEDRAESESDAVQSTDPDGKVDFYPIKGKMVRAIIKEYSPDKSTCVLLLDDGTIEYGVQVVKVKPKSGGYIIQE